MKNNREFRRVRSEKVREYINDFVWDIAYLFKWAKPDIRGTYFAPSIKQTRIINRLKELRNGKN